METGTDFVQSRVWNFGQNRCTFYFWISSSTSQYSSSKWSFKSNCCLIYVQPAVGLPDDVALCFFWPFFSHRVVGGNVALWKFDSFILYIRKYHLYLSVRPIIQNSDPNACGWIELYFWLFIVNVCNRLIYLDPHPYSNKPRNRMLQIGTYHWLTARNHCVPCCQAMEAEPPGFELGALCSFVPAQSLLWEYL